MSNAPQTLARPHRVSRTRGFSIVELMVAVTLALIVTSAVLSAFLGSRSSFMSTSGTAALSDNGRFALDFLQAAVRDAGYMACNTTQRQLSLLNVAVGKPLYYNFGQPLGGYEANNTVSGSFTLAAAPLTATSTPVTPDPSLADWLASTGPAWGGNLDSTLANLVIKNSDVLVVNSTLRTSNPPALVTAITTGASNFTVQNSYNLAGSQLAVISDCAKSVVFQIHSAPAPNTPNATISFTSSGGAGNNSASSFPVSFEVGSQVTPVDTTVYYIGKGADGDGALFSYDMGGNTTFGTPTELVPDIENMQILYGVDTTGTQTVSEYVPAVNVIDFNTVMSVKIAVLAASQPGAVPKQTNPPYPMLGNQVSVPADTRARQVFEITVSTRNMED
jgi:type IV pilus assembly protein PilW